MTEEQRDTIGRLALLVFIIESRKTQQHDRERAEQELKEKAAKLNELCNGKPAGC